MGDLAGEMPADGAEGGSPGDADDGVGVNQRPDCPSGLHGHPVKGFRFIKGVQHRNDVDIHPVLGADHVFQFRPGVERIADLDLNQAGLPGSRK
ncbi:hypothetical protein D9M70_595980 [compost metagenome]